MSFKIGDWVLTLSKFKGKWKVNKTIYEVFDIKGDKLIVSVRPSMYIRRGEKQSMKTLTEVFSYDDRELAQVECDRRNNIETI